MYRGSATDLNGRLLTAQRIAMRARWASGVYFETEPLRVCWAPFAFGPSVGMVTWFLKHRKPIDNANRAHITRSETLEFYVLGYGRNKPEA
jgi:hypothetical protein